MLILYSRKAIACAVSASLIGASFPALAHAQPRVRSVKKGFSQTLFGKHQTFVAPNSPQRIRVLQDDEVQSVVGTRIAPDNRGGPTALLDQLSSLSVAPGGSPSQDKAKLAAQWDGAARRGRAKDLSEKEYAELLRWGRHQQGQLGVLLTPPIGRIAGDVNAAKAFIEKMIDNLAGPELKAQGLQPVVNIYGSDVANAFAREFKSKEAFSPEKDWREDTPWPIRRLYGVAADAAFREIGITTGLLNRYSTLGPLAFVIGHELTHLLERHTELPEFKEGIAKRWWSMQQYEVVADGGALKLMTGKYDLNGAVAALTDLAQLAPKEGSSITAGTQSHHEPGFRIALAQMEVHRRLMQSKEAYQPEQALPPYMKLGRMAPRPRQVPYREKNIANFSVLARAILDDPDAAWIENVDYMAIRRIQPDYTFGDRSPESIRQHVMAGVKIFLDEPSSPNQLIAFFKLLFFLDAYHGRWEVSEALLRLSPEEKIQIRYLLTRGSARGGRKPEDAVCNSFKPDSYLNLERLLELKEVQELLAPLIMHNSKWQNFLRLMPRLASYSSVVLQRNGPQQLGVKSLATLRWLLERVDSGQLGASFLELVADHVAELGTLPKAAMEEYFTHDSLNSSFFFYYVFGQAEKHRGGKQSGEWQALVKAMEPLFQGFLRYRDKKLLEFAGLLSSPFERERQYSHVLYLLSDPSVRDSRYPPPAEAVRLLRHALADHIVPWTIRNGRNDRESETPMIVLGEMLGQKDFSIEQKHRILAAMLSFQPLHGDEIPAEKQKRVAAFIHDFMAEEGQTDHVLGILKGGEIGLLPLLGRDEAQSLRVVQLIPWHERQKLLSDMFDRFQNLFMPLQLDGGRFLLDLFIAWQKDVPDLSLWANYLDRLLKVSPLAAQGRKSNDSILRGFLNRRLAALATDELAQALKLPRVLKTLSAEESAGWLLRLLPDASAATRGQLGAISRELFAAYPLSSEFPAVERQLQLLIARRYRLQPGETALFFPKSYKSVTEKTASSAEYIRGMSALMAEIHTRPPNEQFDALQYLLGAHAQLPAFIGASDRGTLGDTGLVVIFNKVREWASQDNPIGRILIANSILAGPQGMLSREGGERILLDHVLDSVDPGTRELAESLAVSVLRSHGHSRTLAAAYVLGSAQSSNGAADAGSLLRSLLLAHGAPGVKLGQFLAFTRPELRGILGEMQDNARNLGELEVVESIEARFGDDWPAHYEVLGVLGTGSVNAAIEIKNMELEKESVLTMAYPNIEAETAQNFRRVERIVAELTVSDSGGKEYGFLRDLLPFIRDSVTLEFDKQNAFEMQALAQRIYRQEVDGWKIRSVPATETHHMSLFMDKAPGITARMLLETDPKTYREVMGILSGIEYEALMGTDRSVEAFANPDFHDGQVLVDLKTKTIFVLDFGQAVRLTDSDRRIGLRLLRIAAGLDRPGAVVRWVRDSFGITLSSDEVAKVLASSDRMQRFIKLIAKIRSRGGDVSIGSVHWVLAVNRQLALSNKIGGYLGWRVGLRLIASKLRMLQ